MLQIQQTAPGGWLAATIPGRLVIVGCESSNTGFPIDLWESLNATDSVQPVLDRLTRNGILATPSFVLIQWSGSLGEESRDIRCIVRGSARVSLTTPEGVRTVSASSVSTWLEQVVEQVSDFQIDLIPDNQESFLPLEVGAAWVSSVRSSAEACESLSSVADPETKAGKAPSKQAPNSVRETEVSVETIVETSEDAGPSEASETQAPVLSEATLVKSFEADEPASPGGYDHLFGATMMRSVEDAAVRPDEDDEDDEDDEGEKSGESPKVAPPTFVTDSLPTPPTLTEGDHDGMTVFSGDIKKLRGKRQPAPSQESAPQPTPQYVLALGEGVNEPLDGTVLVGRAPSVSKVSGGNVPRLVRVGGADQDISRNHVQFSVEGDTVVVTDLHSRNGTMIVLPGKSPQKLRQGEPTAVILGTVVDLGGGVTMTVDSA